MPLAGAPNPLRKGKGSSREMRNSATAGPGWGPQPMGTGRCVLGDRTVHHRAPDTGEEVGPQLRCCPPAGGPGGKEQKTPNVGTASAARHDGELWSRSRFLCFVKRFLKILHYALFLPCISIFWMYWNQRKGKTEVWGRPEDGMDAGSRDSGGTRGLPPSPSARHERECPSEGLTLVILKEMEVAAPVLHVP